MSNEIIIKKVDYSTQNNISEICEILGIVYQFSGFTRPADNDFVILAKSLIAQLNENYNLLQMHEVRTALTEGALGRYGDIFGINLRMFVKWLDCYLESDKRQIYLASLRVFNANNAPKQIVNEIILTEEENAAERRKLINNAYQLFLDNKVNDWYFHHIQDMLNAAGIRTDAKAYFTQAKKQGKKVIFNN